MRGMEWKSGFLPFQLNIFIPSYPFLNFQNKLFHLATPENRKPHTGASLSWKEKFQEVKNNRRTKENKQKKTSVKNRLGQILKISKDEWTKRRKEKMKQREPQLKINWSKLWTFQKMNGMTKKMKENEKEPQLRINWGNFSRVNMKMRAQMI